MKIEAILDEHIHSFLQGLKKEGDGDKEAFLIIQQYIKDGKITEVQEKVLKIQFMDSLKIIGIGIPFAIIPGASILMPLILRIAEKHNIDLLPAAFQKTQTPK